jgi:hypothetical protein
LDKASLFNYNNYSVPKDDPIHDARNIGELSNAIKNHMTPCHIVIVLAGVYATYSKWIDREIAMASNGFASPKPVLGVKPWGNRRTSTVVARSADDIVGWNTNSIVSAIRELSI